MVPIHAGAKVLARFCVVQAFLVQVYLTGVMVVGGRLTPGYLMNHMNTMGQVLEAFRQNDKVNYKKAFMVCLIGLRVIVFVISDPRNTT